MTISVFLCSVHYWVMSLSCKYIYLNYYWCRYFSPLFFLLQIQNSSPQRAAIAAWIFLHIASNCRGFYVVISILSHCTWNRISKIYDCVLLLIALSFCTIYMILKFLWNEINHTLETFFGKILRSLAGEIWTTYS